MLKYLYFLFVFFVFHPVYGQCPPLINGQLVLSTQQDLDDFTSNYPNCTSIQGHFTLNGSINNVTNLDFIKNVNGAFTINNTQITAITSFNKLESVGETFLILDNNLLENINGFNSLSSIPNTLIAGNNKLVSINGFKSLEVMTSDFYISRNPVLTAVLGFNSVKEVVNVLSFDDNPNLKNIPDFNNLVTVGTQLQLINSGLEEISGFNKLEKIGHLQLGGLSIFNNSLLKTVTGFNSLSDSGFLRIMFNDSLENIRGLRNLERITWYLRIAENLKLTSLEGLNSLLNVSDNSFPEPPESFILTNNPLLSDCFAICPLLISTGVYGTVVISNNLPGCNSEEQVIDGCLIEELNVPNFFTPNNDGINDTWKIQGVFNQNFKVFIYDRFGKLLVQLNPIEEWNGEYNGVAMPSTDYWYKIEFEDGTKEKGHFSLIRH